MTLHKREKQETTFKAYSHRSQPRRFQGNRGLRGQEENRDRYQPLEEERIMRFFKSSALNVDVTETKDRSVVT